MKQYPALRLFAAHGYRLALALAVAAVIVVVWAGLAGAIGWLGVVAGIAIVTVLFGVMLVFVDLVNVISDMLIPP